MKSKELCFLLKDNGLDFFTGVPCSILSDIIKFLSTTKGFEYIPATREDEAIGIAVGALMGGKTPVVLMQNSGIGNSINALTSLALLYDCPLLLIISWRGYQGKDEPEHTLMGRYMLDFLNIMKIPTEIISTEKVREQIKASVNKMKKEKATVALILRKGVID